VLPRHRETISMLVPHYALAPYFFLLFVWRIYRNLFEVPRKYYFAIQDYNEVFELILAVGFFLFMFFQSRRIRAKTGATSMRPTPQVADTDRSVTQGDWQNPRASEQFRDDRPPKGQSFKRPAFEGRSVS